MDCTFLSDVRFSFEFVTVTDNNYGYMPPPPTANHHYFAAPPAPSPPRAASVIQAAASSSYDDLYFLDLGFQQRAKKKVKRIKSGEALPPGAKRKSREGRSANNLSLIF